MSKSLGNSVYASDWLATTRPIVARYGLMTAHYRSDIDIHEGFLEEAAKAFGRIEGFLDRSAHLDAVPGHLPDAFAQAMDDDLGTPIALAALHESVRAGNAALDGGDSAQAASLRGAVVAMCDVLGINPASDEWAGEVRSSGTDDALARVVEALIAKRHEARQAKDFALSDTLRDLLADSGIVVEDGSDGSTWRIDG